MITKYKDILDQLGGTSLYPDGLPQTLRKIVEAEGGTPVGFDPVSLVRQWLVALGESAPYLGKEELLRRVCTAYGGTPNYLGGDRLLDAILDVASAIGRLAAPANVDAVADFLDFDVTFDAVVDAVDYEWRLDNAGAWTSTGAATSFSGTTDAGLHTVSVRAIDNAGVRGFSGSDSFTTSEALSYYFRPGGVDTYFRPGGVDTYIRP